MQKSVFMKGALIVLGLVGMASAQFRYWDVADTSKTPKLLSATGMYANLALNKNLTARVTRFDVNSALWSDATAKMRWVLVKQNTRITFQEKNDYWVYPDSTVFMKNFAVDTVAGDTTTRVLWETRFLILKKEAKDPGAPTKKSDVWYGFSYKWRADQKEADLVPDTGLKASIKWFPKGKAQPAVLKKWIFPPRDKCLECHRTEEASDTLHGRSVLGFFTAQLNMPSPLTPGINQIDDLFNKQILSGIKPANWTNSPRWYGITSTDPAATLEKKSRAYIAANCSGCHGDRGMEVGATFGVDLNYDYYTGTPHMKYEYKTTSWGYGLDTVPPIPVTAEDERFFGAYLVTPGYPQKSVILFRQQSRNQAAADDITGFDPDRNQMPPLASFEVNADAVKVMSDWIANIPKTGAPLSTFRSRLTPLGQPFFQGRNLHLPFSMAQGNPKVEMLGINGRSIVLPRIGNGVYSVPSSAARGIYVLRVGMERFTRYLQ